MGSPHFLGQTRSFLSGISFFLFFSTDSCKAEGFLRRKLRNLADFDQRQYLNSPSMSKVVCMKKTKKKQDIPI